MFFDSHLHLAGDIAAEPFFSEARAKGVSRFLVAGTSLEDGNFLCNLANPEAGIYVAVGMHPHAAAQFAVADLPGFRNWLQLPGVVAVGEIGLDFYYDFSPRADQERVFTTFLELAAEVKKPVIIHCREAFAPCFELVSEYYAVGLPFVVHSFTGTVAEAEQWLRLGAYLSFNGMVTFKKADNIRSALAVVPQDRLLLETDSPYLAPVPYRGKTNTPAFLPAVAEKVAQELHMEVDELAALTTANACRLFGIQK
ncbi:MAG: TatD family hydrolase [Lentisphaeria bacterium]